ncbi:TonB-dependent siderophore receptor [Methylocystis bryophila]|uniref:TonB-dependent receptor n=1 Tax=Methylocystis bryophila TaxID=655015 RepID=A0A1W6N253_9HYPH|nr:TonB-dependent siderophore receptor [Methylocystis bryophila]ARN83889.1 hypothetical protein B1812_21645 [Methylocystis bryophila]BDV40998.1 hypothetical protein DSM21852_42520 [Methylocystis bryophila]
MQTNKLRCGASATAVAISLWSTDLLAQTSLPSIDIGRPKPVTHAAAKPKPSPHTGVSHVAQGGRGNGRPVPGQGTGGGAASGGTGAGQGGGGDGGSGGGGAGTGAGGYGGAGPAQDPYNKSYVLEKASTGTKTNTPVMETPLNVQSVSQQVLRDQQVVTLPQALQNFAGVSVPGPASGLAGTPSSGLFIRGFQTNTYYRNGFRIDGTLNFGDYISTQQFANVASVEVLKGPGAILYGLSDPGGVINIVTKEPLDAPYYAAQQQVGSLALYRTTVDATGPLNTDKSLLYRMNMSYENNGAPFGYFVDLTNSENLFLAPVVKWNVDSATWVKLEAEYNQHRGDIYFPFDPLFNGAFVNIPRSANYGESSPYLTTQLLAALTWSHQFDKDWSIKQQIVYNNIGFHDNITYGYGVLAGPPALVPQQSAQTVSGQTTYATNVDITGHLNTFGAEHTVLLGGDVYHTTGQASSMSYNFSSVIGLFDPIHLGIPNPQCPCSFFPADYTQDTAGLYLQDQIKLPYNFFLLTGARYQYIRQTILAGEAQYALQPAPPLNGQALTPRFGLLWRPQEWLSLYGNYTEGFGPNAGIYVYPGNLAPPTRAQSWEAGAKLELFGGKLRATADYFELVKTNVPFPDVNPAHICPGGGGGLGSCSLLAGAARSTGPEVEIQGEILPGWSVIAAYTNDDVRVTKAQPGANPGVGQRFSDVPRNQASLWTTYELQNDSALKGWKFGAGYHYFGSRPVIDTTNPPWAWPLVPAYGTVDLMAAYSFSYAGSKMTAQLNVTNLFNRAYSTDEYNTGTLGPGPGFSTASFRSYGAPFAVMGSLRAELDKGATPAPWLLPAPTASPSLPSFTWTGFYTGGQVGYGLGLNDGWESWSTAQGQSGQSNLGSGATGVIGGAHVGYNQQFDQWVLGLEGSVDGATLTKNAEVLAPSIVGQALNGSCVLFQCFGSTGGTVTSIVHSGVQGSVRARAGYAFGRLLPYATGGVAFGTFKSDAQLFGTDLDGLTNFAASGAASTTRVGWTAGAGVEYAVNNHWSLRAEYRYSDFGHLGISTDPSAVGAVFALDRHLDQQQVQVGFSYKLFAGPELEAPPLITKGPALAGNDLPKLGGVAPSIAPFAMNWSGFYVGAQIGYGWGLNDGSLTYATPGGLAGQSNLSSGAIVIGGSNNQNADAIGVIGGAHLGYNQQYGKWVVGVEGSVDPTLMGRSPLINVPNLALVDPITLANDVGATASGAIWSRIQGSLRARAGYALGRMLFYGTGGLAIGEFSSNFQLYGLDTTGAPFYAADRRSATRLGWTLGAGVEYAINPHWSVRGEYRYTDFGHMGDSPAPTSMGGFYTADRHLDQQQVQVGVSYRFNDGVLAPVETNAIVADLPSIKGPAILEPPPPASWTGVYAGANLGGGWSVNNNNSTNFLPFTDPSFPLGASALPGGGSFSNLVYLPGGNDNTAKTAGVVGGGQLGYNFQIDRAIIGAEADIQGATIASGHNGAYLSVLASPFIGGSVLAPLAGGAPVGNVGVPWFGTLRGRAGWLLNPTLALYGTGGFAYSGLQVAGYSTTASGWTVGTGGEWMFAPNWSAKLEYLYINATSSSNGGLGAFSGVGSSRLSPAINVVRTGLNYHFNWAAPEAVLAKY